MMKKMNVVAYARFSSDNQRIESIDAQLRAIKEFCLKENYQLVDVYSDEVRSGLSDERPGFLRMIDDAEKNKFQAIIVHKLDRFSRDRYDSALYKRKLKKCGVRLFSVLERLDDSPESIILESVLEGMAEYYSENLARETFKGLKENALQCLHNGGTPPLGYDVNPQSKKYEINVYEAETVQIIYDMYLNDHGYFDIIRSLNAAGRKTKRGKPFGKNSIYELLRNEKYTGTYIYNRIENRRKKGNNSHNLKSADDVIKIKDGMPCIIEQKQFVKVKEKMEKNRRASGRYKNKYVYPLSGLIVCGHCGSSYCGERRRAKGHDYFYYICSNKKNKGQCNAKDIRKDHLEEIVKKVIEARLYTSSGIAATAKIVRDYAISNSMQNSSKLSASKMQYEKVKDQIDRLIDSIMGGMFHESMKEKLTSLEEKKSCIEKEIYTYENTMDDKVPSLDEIKYYIACDNLRTMDELELKKCFQKHIKKITIRDGDHVQISLVVDINGTPRGARTPNLLVRSQALYPIELWAHISRLKKNDLR